MGGVQDVPIERNHRDMRWLTIKFHKTRRLLASIETMLWNIYQQGVKIMSAISDFAAKQAQFNVRLSAAIDGVAADVASLNAKIEELQNTPGAITPEDQALLDQLQAQGEAIASRLEAVDNLTPPVPPTS